MDKSWTQKQVGQFIIHNTVLGKGQYATVYQAFLQNGTPVAAKTIIKDQILQSCQGDQQLYDKQVEQIRRQIGIQRKVKHPFIIDFYDVKETPKNILFFLRILRWRGS
ncbi:protein kinase domain protein [Ichthyophthirius multifiliis]|uniref:non-specific serine/threonine protein kinase n=1 Tax=Ichthyophthirius multifiliis TaxID=5932 RepID=G0R2L3_ICHMU|nr:protein kinase domain protein [Ichthyophthirius multifiliis]EGR28277.1 protein kinase domain protein [Ichthyophthirius multifiliis]|eukprot:XP_004027622.1 protein kinase domain protein [Ichthyophthirius multifiliis]